MTIEYMNLGKSFYYLAVYRIMGGEKNMNKRLLKLRIAVILIPALVALIGVASASAIGWSWIAL